MSKIFVVKVIKGGKWVTSGLVNLHNVVNIFASSTKDIYVSVSGRQCLIASSEELDTMGLTTEAMLNGLYYLWGDKDYSGEISVEVIKDIVKIW